MWRNQSQIGPGSRRNLEVVGVIAVQFFFEMTLTRGFCSGSREYKENNWIVLGFTFNDFVSQYPNSMTYDDSMTDYRQTLQM